MTASRSRAKIKGSQNPNKNKRLNLRETGTNTIDNIVGITRNWRGARLLAQNIVSGIQLCSAINCL